MIEFENVSFSYQGRKKETAVKNLNFHIKEGETIVLCGESGCGKSTVTRIINGLIPHFYGGKLEGTVKIAGEDIRDKTLYQINTRTGSVFQNPRTQFFNVDTDGELVFGCENRAVPVEEIQRRAEDAVEFFEIEDLMHRSIYSLSGGQQQQIACASAYCTRPDILVMDEPSSNLDADAIEVLGRNLKMMKEKGKTLVIAEHRLYYLVDTADRFIYFKDGRIAGIYTNAEMCSMTEEELSKMGLRSLQKRQKTEAEAETFPRKMEIRGMDVCYKDPQSRKKCRITMDGMDIPMNEITAVVGENGTGKSTLLRTIAGLQKDGKADVTIDGEKCSRKQRLKESFLVMQDVNHQLFTESVEEEIRLGAKNLTEEKLSMLLEQFHLSHLRHSHPMNLSGGEKQRVLLAAAVSSGKKILLLDEPTGGLDRTQMNHVAEVLKKTCDQVECIIVVTHDPEFIRSCCTAVRRISTEQRN